MRSKTVKRYYCDHCSKGSFRKPDMAQHELSCTLNPNRVCYLCDNGAITTEHLSSLVAELKKRCPDDDDCWGAATKDDVAWLLQEVHQCPACALSVLRQAKVYGQDFNYQELKREWWAERSREFRDMVGGNLGSY